ncbi:hypothetical protein V8G54_027210 [Vigna mungo]|uniref:Laccase n=1 Tax=Vigna mungo TaxID=3915 RepID=A0AAQ3RR63_VIGMU
MRCEHSESWIQIRNTLLQNKMTNVIPSSAAFSVATLFVSSILWTIPNDVLSASSNYGGVTRHYQFDIRLQSITRLCHTKNMLTVNGKFPGPRVIAREGDRLVVKVVNHVPNNITIHCGWSDGPSYITQCPVQSGQSYVYNFSLVGQRGTLFWHAHHSWLRATLYGPLIILPRTNESYPFAKPYKEIPILFGEWWNVDPEAVIAQALHTGGGPNASDAYTINGLPGPLYNCSSNVNNELFFSIANHTMTVVEADAAYVKPFNSKIIVISPGQTTNVALKTKPKFINATFFMLARPFFTAKGTFNSSTLAGILEYEIDTPPSESDLKNHTLLKPTLPSINDTSFVASFSSKFRSLNSAKYPANVPRKVDRSFFFTIGLGSIPCPRNQTCEGPNKRTKFAASMNNISFNLPSVAILEQHFSGKDKGGVYTTDFPVVPPRPFNYTGTPPNNSMVKSGTKVVVIPYNTRVQVVLQDTSILGAESHPLHLHGFNMLVVGQGFGNYDPVEDPGKFNLVDPVERNTIGVPSGGWVAIRFVADNPGVWLMHCHIDLHLSWGLRMAWIVNNGKLSHQKLLPPPSDLPKC